jgi:hypothetical protein
MMKWLLSQSRKVTTVCTKMLNVQTMRSRSFGGKTTKAYCSLWAEVVGFRSLFLFSLLTGDVASAYLISQLAMKRVDVV